MLRQCVIARALQCHVAISPTLQTIVGGFSRLLRRAFGSPRNDGCEFFLFYTLRCILLPTTESPLQLSPITEE